MKFIFIVFALTFFFLNNKADDDYNFPNQNDPSSSKLDNDNKLKELLDNIAKIRKEHEGLLNQDSSSLLPNLKPINPFESDDLCLIQTQEECEVTCTKAELCRPCFKSQQEGFGLICLISNP